MNHKIELMTTIRRDMPKLEEVLAGHLRIGIHAHRLVSPCNAHCHSLDDPPKEENVFYFLCECPALMSRRMKFLDGSLLTSLFAMPENRVMNLLRFHRATEWGLYFAHWHYVMLLANGIGLSKLSHVQDST